ncbi:hypothetical protein ONA92_18430 [Mycobacteroides salmoniphilum]|uniref:hypothetical protein n=1 Tax=Mycobacteroides salmoniphilum TaxID=404941 RepID=UPI00356575E4
MTAREVVVSVAAYTDVNGVRDFALRGETIDVHPDHVERFDRLNIVPGTPVVTDPVLVIDDSDDSDDTDDEVAEDGAESGDIPSELPEDETPAELVDVAEEPATSAEPVGDDRLDAVLDLGAPKRPARSARAKG